MIKEENILEIGMMPRGGTKAIIRCEQCGLAFKRTYATLIPKNANPCCDDCRRANAKAHQDNRKAAELQAAYDRGYADGLKAAGIDEDDGK